MTKIHVGSVGDFEEGTCRLLTVEGREIGIRAHAGELYAYENRCLHQGGPVCEGVLVARVEDVVRDGAVVEQRFADGTVHLVCPWHGYEYDLTTGELAFDRSRRLRRYEVERSSDGEVYLVV